MHTRLHLLGNGSPFLAWQQKVSGGRSFELISEVLAESTLSDRDIAWPKLVQLVVAEVRGGPFVMRGAEAQPSWEIGLVHSGSREVGDFLGTFTLNSNQKNAIVTALLT